VCHTAQVYRPEDETAKMYSPLVLPSGVSYALIAILTSENKGGTNKHQTDALHFQIRKRPALYHYHTWYWDTQTHTSRPQQQQMSDIYSEYILNTTTIQRC